MDSRQDLPVIAIPSQADWEAWLEAHHAASKGVWLRMARKGAGEAGLSYAEAVDSALCFGWIDGQKASQDDRFWLQKFTPRSRRSRWSRINRERATALQQQGRMRPAGLAEMERAQRDGRWEAAYEPQRTAAVPDDLQRELERHPEAGTFFATLDSRNRYAILYRLQDAKKPDTRARRLAQFVAMLSERKKLYP